MFNLKKFTTTSLLASCALFSSIQANAAMISTSIDMGSLANVVSFDLEIDDTLINSGIGMISTAESGLSLIDFTTSLFSPSDVFIDSFSAFVDPSNLDAGLTSFDFQVEDNDYYRYTSQWTADWSEDATTSTAATPFIEIEDVYYADFASLISASYGSDMVVSTSITPTQVSEPSMLGFLALAFAGMAYRRKQG